MPLDELDVTNERMNADLSCFTIALRNNNVELVRKDPVLNKIFEEKMAATFPYRLLGILFSFSMPPLITAMANAVVNQEPQRTQLALHIVTLVYVCIAWIWNGTAFLDRLW